MKFKEHSFKDLLVNIVDNRGKTCPTSDSGLPLIATNCIKNDALFPVFEKVRYVDNDTYENWFRGHPESGDMIFVCKGSPGRVAWVPDPVNFCIAQDMVAIRADETKVYPKYLFALLRSNQTQQKILNMHVGTLIPHFKKGDFGNLYLDIPEDFEYQKQVGDTYFEFCKKIELNRQINQTLEHIAQAIFKSWFVDFEPVKAKIHAKQNGQDPERAAMCAISGKTDTELDTWLQTCPPEQRQQLITAAALFPDELEDTELGSIPKGWEWKEFGDVIEILDSKRIPLSKRQREERKGKYRYYGATSVMDYVDDYLFDGTYVLMAEDGSVMDRDGYPTIQYVWGKFWVNNHAHILKGVGSVSDENILLFLKDTVISPYVTGAVQLKINQKNMKSMPFLYATDRIHEEFSKVASKLFEAYKVNAEEVTTLSEARDSLLPKLLSGVLSTT